MAARIKLKYLSIFISGFILLFGCSDKNSTTLIDGSIISCDAENIELIDDKSTFVNGSYHFAHGELQSDDFAHRGNYSCKVLKGAQIGMALRINDVKKGDYLEISIWQLNKGGNFATTWRTPRCPKVYH